MKEECCHLNCLRKVKNNSMFCKECSEWDKKNIRGSAREMNRNACNKCSGRIKQLQKEIGDDSQTRQSKETSVEKGGGKAERYLFNSDNVSSADTLKLNHKCPICDKDIYLRDDTVNEKGVIYHLGCYLFENHFTINDSLKDIWDNSEDDRWDKEYNPDLLPETLKNKEEKQDE